MERRGKWTASKSASLVAVRQIYAAICASNNLAGAMKRVPTKFFSGQVAAMPLIPDHKFPRFSPMERARDTFERREREREGAAVEKHGEDGFTFLGLS